MKDNTKIKTYKNGARIIVETDKTAPYESFSLNVYAGSEKETPEEFGCAHFLEHMAFKSNEKLTTKEILNTLASLGARYNAYTSNLKTCYHFSCLKEKLEDCLSVYSDMFYNNLFLEDEFKKEKQVILEEYYGRNDSPNIVSFDNAYLPINSMFLPYPHSIIGTKESIENLTTQHLRNYKKKHYIGSNIIFSFCGNITLKDATKMIEKYFAKTINAKSAEPTQENGPITPLETFNIIERDVQQVKMNIAIKMHGMFDEKRFISRIYRYVLGSGLNSRLSTELREKQGLAYSTSAGHSSNINFGVSLMYIATTPEKLPKAITGIYAILKDLADNGITKEELDSAKIAFKSSIAFDKESRQSNSQGNASEIFYKGDILSDEEFLEKINSVTIEDVNAYAKELYNEKTYAVGIVGKGLNREELKKLFDEEIAKKNNN